MPLCTICKSIPFRSILEGDKSLPLGYSEDGAGPSYHVRSYDSIPRLIDSGETCELCDIIAKSLESSVWYQSMMMDEDRNRPLWLGLDVWPSSPSIRMYLGKNSPETQLFGQAIGIYTALDSPLTEKVTNRNVQESPTHDHSLKQIELWLDDCRGNHSQCSHVVSHEMKLPTRVLDLDTLPRREAMVANKSWRNLFQNGKCKLAETHAKEYGQYVALSYCWGASLAYKTTKDNRVSHMKEIDFTCLPKTLQDAIYITRYLGLRYIWIDCLCIVQDDKADWQREAASMAEVYSNSWLTIAASRARDSSEGFFGPRKTRFMDPVSFEDDKGPFQLYFISEDVSALPGSMDSVRLEPLRSEPLSKRVWTLQERLLAIRTLHYATDQMYWECAESSNCEDGSNFGTGDEDFRLGDIIKGLKSVSLADTALRHWYQLIQAYTSRSMTYQSDKFPALSGVIATIQRQTNDTYCAGIWKTHFLAGLLWRLEDPDRDLYVFAPKQPKRLDFWRAPSWSFAAVEGVIRYEIHPSGTDYCAELEQCSLTPSGANPLGELEAGFARIRGPIATIEQVGQERSFDGFNCYLRLRDQQLTKAKVFFDFERHENSAVLMLSPNAGLAISLVDVAENSYVRVGVVRTWKDFDDPPLSTPQLQEPTSIVLL